MAKTGLKVCSGGGGLWWWVVESKFSVQLRPKLNNRKFYTEIIVCKMDQPGFFVNLEQSSGLDCSK